MSPAEAFRPYDPSRETPADANTRRALEPRDRAGSLTLRGFTTLSTALALGFRRLNYAAATNEQGVYRWITDEHARALGRGLRSLDYLGLELTTFEGDGLAIAARELPAGTRIGELCVAHKSGDEVTPTEAAGLAHLATRAGCATVHLWAGEFATGSLEALVATLEALGNETLLAADVCDVSKPEPSDRIVHAPLERLVERNRARRARGRG